MADPKGFMKTPRMTPARRPVDIRIRDWREVYKPQPIEELQNKLVGAWTVVFRFVIRAALWEI